MLISLPRRLLSHSTLSTETSAAVQHASENSATKLVRPQLKYALSVWDNTVKRNTTKVEAVQRSMARFTCRDCRRTTSVTAMLQKLQWDSLQQRQACSRVLMLYTVLTMDWLTFLPQSVSSQLWSIPEGSKPATDRSSATQACTTKPFICSQTMEHLASWCLPAAAWQL